MSKRTMRVSLDHFELAHLTDFAANVDVDSDEALQRWDRMTQKLENALARLEDRAPRSMRTPRPAWEPDRTRAICRACGWEGLLARTSPCPNCGQKVNPLLFDSTNKER